MNIVMRATRPEGFSSNRSGNKPVGTGAYYIATIRKTDLKSKDGNNLWGVRGKIINGDGTLREQEEEKYYRTQNEAEKRCRKLAKRKRALKKYKDIPLSELPDVAMRHLVPDPDSWVDPSEMASMIEEAKRERYVWFDDVTGMEEYFQTNLEYLALVTVDPDIYLVMDKYGEWRDCMKERFSMIENTERTEQVLRVLSTNSIQNGVKGV